MARQVNCYISATTPQSSMSPVWLRFVIEPRLSPHTQHHHTQSENVRIDDAYNTATIRIISAEACQFFPHIRSAKSKIQPCSPYAPMLTRHIAQNYSMASVRERPPRRQEALPGTLELPTLRLTASRSSQLCYGSK